MVEENKKKKMYAGNSIYILNIEIVSLYLLTQFLYFISTKFFILKYKVGETMQH